jgi:hypothetical protein
MIWARKSQNHAPLASSSLLGNFFLDLLRNNRNRSTKKLLVTLSELFSDDGVNRFWHLAADLFQ